MSDVSPVTADNGCGIHRFPCNTDGYDSTVFLVPYICINSSETLYIQHSGLYEVIQT